MIPDKRILVVDDDPNVREPLVDFFRSKGYKVNQQPWGRGALDLYKERGPFDLVLTDFNFLPSKEIRHGADLVREIRKLAPDQRMAIMTGDGKAAREALDASVKDVPILVKGSFPLAKLMELLPEA
jgi:DNA-binding NtrC family response regulator